MEGEIDMYTFNQLTPALCSLAPLSSTDSAQKASERAAPALAAPVWLQEIKSNEIFNKRKKISGLGDEQNVEDEEEDEYPDVKILHKTIDQHLLSKKEYVY